MRMLGIYPQQQRLWWQFLEKRQKGLLRPNEKHPKMAVAVKWLLNLFYNKFPLFKLCASFHVQVRQEVNHNYLL